MNDKVQKLSDDALDQVNGGSDLEALLRTRRSVQGNDTLDRSINNPSAMGTGSSTSNIGGISPEELAKRMMEESSKNIGQPLPKLELLG